VTTDEVLERDDRPTARPGRCHQAETWYEPTSLAPVAGRRFVRAMLELWHADDLCDVAELLTSELVTNVVRHAATPVSLALRWDVPRLRVAVGDGSPTLPVVATRATLGGGYGLRLVTRLATDWGVTPTPEGKVVWFVLDREESARA